jgi:ketosteroid isomerase-like protein
MDDRRLGGIAALSLARGRRRQETRMTIALPFLILALATTTQAQSKDAAELTALLNEFLAGASRNDAAVHERFWSDDLIYTGSAGRRIGKADLMKDVSAPASAPDEHPATYTAEDVRIQQYGDTALVAFRLVATTRLAGATRVRYFLNTGTFVKRNGKWQAVGWQATRVPLSAEEATKEVAAAESAFDRALLARDVKALQSLVDEMFVWTHRTGERQTRQQLLDDLGTGQLAYSKLETSDVAIAVHGDTAVVRGRSLRQRSAIPRGEGQGKGDPEPYTAIYTLVFVNGGDGWKAVALHTNRPQGN